MEIIKQENMKKSLAELEGIIDVSTGFQSRLMNDCDLLIKKPLNTLTARDLRVLISQNIGVTFLIPIAVKLLESDALVDAEYYPGDLLVSIISMPNQFFASRLGLLESVNNIASKALEELTTRPSDEVGQSLAKDLVRDITVFLNKK